MFNTSLHLEWYAKWALCRGPAKILRCYEERSTASVLDNDDFFEAEFGEENPVLGGFILGSLERIWEERQVANASKFQAKIILEQVAGESAKCTLVTFVSASWLNSISTGQHCDSVQGLELWNETSEWHKFTSFSLFSAHFWLDWRLLPGIIPVDALQALFKGRLSSNPSEMTQFRHDIQQNTIPHSQIMQEIFDLGLSTHSSKQDWLCLACIRELLHENLHLWLLENKRSGKR
jgi:hypothetical protein